jgi:hypothetical protein
MSWLETHIEEFVLPQLKKMDEDFITSVAEAKCIPRDEVDPLLHKFSGKFNRAPLNYFSSEEKSVIKNAWRSVKKSAGDKPILLAGRDVFIFEILARRENYPTTFIPECSRLTVRALKNKIPNVKNYFLFDTGFVGSIPNNLGIKNFNLLSYSSLGDIKQGVGTQTFPRMTWSRGLALKIENTPKYWETGRLLFKDGNALNEEVISQPFSHRGEFEKAARLTIEIYTDSSPKFVKKHRPIVIERR